jgi:hypothetical protein
MRFLRPLLGLTRLDHHRNPDIFNRLKGHNLIEGIELYKKTWLHHLDRIEKSCLTKLASQHQPRGQQDAERSRTP